jgi:hypothetical protein
MAPVFPTSYLRLLLNFNGGACVETAFDMYRSDVGPITVDNPGVLLQSNVALLGERGVFIDDTAPIGVDLWWRAVGTTCGEVNIFGPFQQTTGIGFMWVKDPLRPWADIPFDTCDLTQGHAAQGCELVDPEFVWGGFGDLEQDSDAGLFPILNAERPADVFARRKFADGSFTFFTRTLENIDTVYDLFTAGGPLMIQLPTEYGWHDAFVQPGTLKRSYISKDQRRPERRWEVPFTVVDMPGGPQQGTACNNWCEVDDAFSTYADLTASGATWSTILQGIVLCPPGIEDGFGIGPFGAGPFGDGG